MSPGLRDGRDDYTAGKGEVMEGENGEEPDFEGIVWKFLEDHRRFAGE